ncbi:hypothetical protein ACRRTK_011714 [Alexandromys fortis]
MAERKAKEREDNNVICVNKLFTGCTLANWTALEKNNELRAQQSQPKQSQQEISYWTLKVLQAWGDEKIHFGCWLRIGTERKGTQGTVPVLLRAPSLALLALASSIKVPFSLSFAAESEESHPNALQCGASSTRLYRRVSGNFSGKLIPAPNPQDMSQIMRRVLHSLLLLFAESTAFKNHFLKEQGFPAICSAAQSSMSRWMAVIRDLPSPLILESAICGFPHSKLASARVVGCFSLKLSPRAALLP